MSNAFGNYNEIFFAQEALLVLHKALGMAGRVFRGYDPSPQAYGDTIRLRRPTAFTAANAPAAATDLNPDSVTVTLDQWKEVKFLLTDKDLSLTRPRIIADHITPAAYALADAIDQAGAALYKKIPYGNQASSTFALSDITAAHQGMFNNKVPMNDSANLHAMVGGSMQANILNKLTATTASATQDPALMRGAITSLYGFNWFANQNTPSHTSGVAADNAGTVNGANAIGTTSIAVSNFQAAGTLKTGDILTITGDPQQYNVAADVTFSSGAATITITPGLKQATVASEVITATLFGSAKVQNILFHRNAFALAMAPLSELGGQLGARIATVTDPITNLTLRSRMYYDGTNSAVHVALDVLYGWAILDPNLAWRLSDY